MRLIVVITLFLLPTLSEAAIPNSCQGPYVGKQLTQRQLDHILSTWDQPGKPERNLCGADLHGLNFSGKSLQKANFFGADLSHTNFDNADLSGAYLEKSRLCGSSFQNTKFFRARLLNTHLQNVRLQHTDLRQIQAENADFNGANINDSNFTGSNLTNTYFGNAVLIHTNFSWADLSDANFEEANLRNSNFSHSRLIAANLYGTDLTATKFTDADLTNSNMVQTIMADTNFFQANMTSVHFQPKLGKHPDLVMLANSINFRTLQFHHDLGIPALSELRAAYIKIGLRQMERTITAMLKVKEMQRAWQSGGWGYVQSSLGYLLFYLTSDYGADPTRPLLLFLLLIGLCCLPYYIALRFPSYHNAIKVLWQPNFYAASVPNKQLNQQLQLTLKVRQRPSLLSKLREHWRAIRIAFLFSLQSALQIGWREINLGSWISRLQRREYQLRSFGWVRIIAGSQSLLGAYLLLLWAFTYFGNPFQW